MRIEDDVGIRFHLEHQAQRVTARNRADVAHAVGTFQHTGVARLKEVFFDFFRVVPHGVLLKPRKMNRMRSWSWHSGFRI